MSFLELNWPIKTWLLSGVACGQYIEIAWRADHKFKVLLVSQNAPKVIFLSQQKEKKKEKSKSEVTIFSRTFLLYLNSTISHLYTQDSYIRN